jgi:type I restriction-modification system DNA methylase subunit
MPDVPPKIVELVERFDRNRQQYTKAYNEAQTRTEFIDPFFEALGWDMTNRSGYAEAYKDVIHEDAIKVGGSTEAPDYAFRIGGTRKFFVEAKKPEVSVEFDNRPAYQLRRYSWSAKLPLAILTNFMECAVYDCRFPPKDTDKASLGRIMYLKYSDYMERWSEIAGIFAKDEVLRGSFDRYAESTKGKRGTAEVDTAFLAEIEQWREKLAHNMALRNRLQVEELNYAVQRTIDRIIFLRMCEDRGIEVYGSLQTLANGENVYPRLCQLYLMADDRYNSGLFHFKLEKARAEGPDELTLGIRIDDKVLKGILKGLYYPCPYEFSAIPSDILGNVYEQFLGKVIVLKSPTNATVEERPEVKKAGGVYYTPTYIVDYIVKNTVGKLCEGKTPKQVSKLKILDPACGSGSFLIGAYTHLLTWYRDRYVEDGPGKHRREIYQGRGGQWFLTSTEKKRILLNNVYGVDIDSQAVEVTKLNLLLKVLEDETQETIQHTLAGLHERALPDLGNNIKCGNSLIGSDFFEGRQPDEITEEERSRINAFDWDVEFADIMKAGGFDAVIGNPPYIFTRDKGFTSREKAYYVAHYENHFYQLNTYVLFIEEGRRLLTAGGRLGLIVPNNWLSIVSLKSFRDFLLTHTGDVAVVNNRFKVFAGANVDTSIVSFCKSAATDLLLMESDAPNRYRVVSRVGASEALRSPIIRFGETCRPDISQLVQRIGIDNPMLGEVAVVKAGLKAYETGKGSPPQTDEMKKGRVYHSITRGDGGYRVYLDGQDVRRYQVRWSGAFLKYGDNLAAPRQPGLFDGVRILVRQIPSRPPYCVNAVIVNGEELNDINSMIVRSSSSLCNRYILGMLNSRLLSFWFQCAFEKFQRAIFPQFKVKELAEFPIRAINFDDPEDTARHDRMVKLVESMLDLHKKLPEAKTPDEKNRIQRLIDATDRQMDALVYELYGLTEEEVKIVEEAT